MPIRVLKKFQSMLGLGEVEGRKSAARMRKQAWDRKLIRLFKTVHDLGCLPSLTTI